MRQIARFLVFCCAVSALAQVQTIGDVSFAVPAGWSYKAGADMGAMAAKQDTRFWVLAVYSAMPASGDPNADFKTAWKRVVLAGPDYKGVPNYSPYDIGQSVGYPGKYYESPSVDGKIYTRLYVLETGKTFVPVAFVSQNRPVMDGMDRGACADRQCARRAVAGFACQELHYCSRPCRQLDQLAGDQHGSL